MTREIMQLARQAHAAALPVRESYLLVLPILPPVMIPVVWLDVAMRSDLADLIRVQKTEGCGPTATFWLYSATTFFLHSEWTRPARATLWISFPMPSHKEFLGLVARFGRLSLLLSTPPVWMQTWWCTTPPSQEEVSAVLSESLNIELPSNRELLEALAGRLPL